MIRKIIASVMILGMMTLVVHAQKNATDTFLENAIRTTQYEMQVANQAMQKSKNERVRQQAEKTMKDKQKTLEELHKYAEERNLEVTKDLEPRYQTELNRLNEIGENEYDAEFNKSILQSHENSIRMYEEAMKNDDIEDPKLKKWMEESLPKMKENLETSRNARPQNMNESRNMNENRSFPKRNENNGIKNQSERDGN